ncbi:hypothetical protein [Azospirillum sp.]|uniref:hypothetical protein n=1 Tax=Azospirillum sp. TaxID=34012 RepID=UPI002D4609D2|nr:hypothetical protein [Azospirillum sp.]HYD69916.1 hypothetical protein [Azospirillum sp.]
MATLAMIRLMLHRLCGTVKGKPLHPFDSWLSEAEVNVLAGIRRIEEPVRAALSEPWSRG